MTYSPSQTELEQQISAVQSILYAATTAAAAENWCLVNNCLKQLPLSQSKTKSSLVLKQHWETVFQLALQVLLKADFQQQWEVAKTFPLLGSKIIQPLIELLAETTVPVESRWFICRILGKFNEPEVAIALVELWQQTPEPELREIAAQTLTQMGTLAIAALRDLASQPQYRLLAVKSLACIRSPETIAPLITMVDDAQPEVRTVAIEALGSFRDERILPLLITALQDTAASVRKEAAIALGFYVNFCPELDLVKHLQPLLYDLNLEVCRQAAISLSKTHQQEAAKVLFAVLQSAATPISLKLDLIKALSWTELKIALDYLQQALFSTSETAVSQEIIEILGRTSAANLKPQAAQILIDFWHSQEITQITPPIKQTLATSWGELGTTQAKEALEQLAVDGNKRVQLHAIAALKQI